MGKVGGRPDKPGSHDVWPKVPLTLGELSDWAVICCDMGVGESRICFLPVVRVFGSSSRAEKMKGG